MLSFYQHRLDNYTSQISINNSYPAHLHRQVELIYVKEGSIQVTIDGTDYTLVKGELSICFPNLVHSTYTPESSEVNILIFDVDFVHDFSTELLKTRPEYPILRALQITDEAISCINRLHELYTNTQDSRISMGLFYILLGNIMPHLTLTQTKGIDDLNTCQQILIYIDNNFTNDLTLDSLSSELNISKYYISHIFTSKVKISFPTYLNTRRIRHAKHLLKTTNQSITDICYNSGFNSSRTFYRIFKETYDITPHQYRDSL